MQKSIILQEILSQENSILEKQEGNYYLNGKNINSNLSEFLKILSIAIKKIPRIQNNIEIKLNSILRDLNYSKIESSDNNLQDVYYNENEEEDEDENENEDEEDANENEDSIEEEEDDQNDDNNENQDEDDNDNEKEEEDENEDDTNENQDEDKGYIEEEEDDLNSDNIVNEDEDDNQNEEEDEANNEIDNQDESQQQEKEISQQILFDFLNKNVQDTQLIRIYQDQLEVYLNILCQIYQEQFKETFISPFKLQPKHSLIKLPGKVTLGCELFYLGCDDCRNYNTQRDPFEDIDEKLQQIGVITFQQVILITDIKDDCDHNSGYGSNQNVEQDYILNIQSKPNIKFKELYFEYYVFKLCQGYEREINITQDEILKKVSTSLELLQYTNFTQGEQFLQTLLLFQSNIFQPEVDFLKIFSRIRFSELWISPYYLLKSIPPQKLNELDYLIYLNSDYDDNYIRQKQQKNRNLKKMKKLFNSKYATILSLLTFSKLFDQQFSIFRMMYDLHQL